MGKCLPGLRLYQMIEFDVKVMEPTLQKKAHMRYAMEGIK